MKKPDKKKLALILGIGAFSLTSCGRTANVYGPPPSDSDTYYIETEPQTEYGAPLIDEEEPDDGAADFGEEDAQQP